MLFAVTAVALAAIGLGPVPVPAQDVASDAWVIEPAEALALIADGAIVIDARSRDQRAEAPIDGALAVAWQDFSEADRTNRGKLLADKAALTERLQGLGISRDLPVVVLGTPLQGWGEDGRITWTLRVLGHDRSFMVNGGATAMLAEGPLDIAPVQTPGDFVVEHIGDLGATKEEILASFGQPNVVILDTREAREFQGDATSSDARTGHIPGARHLYFRDFLDGDGRVLEGDALQAILAANGIDESSEVISYCTAGIRSAFVTAVLRDNGINARNYDGSIAEWAAQDDSQFPMSRP